MSFKGQEVDQVYFIQSFLIVINQSIVLMQMTWHSCLNEMIPVIFRFVKFQRVFGWAELFTKWTGVSISLHMFGFNMLIASSLVVSLPLTGQALPRSTNLLHLRQDCLVNGSSFFYKMFEQMLIGENNLKEKEIIATWRMGHTLWDENHAR